MRYRMNSLLRFPLVTILLALIWMRPLCAQDDSDKINSSLGMAVSAPVDPTAEFASLGWGFTAGVGYNFNKYHSLIGEFMWDGLYSTDQATVFGSASESSGGNSGVYGVTGNYRFELRGKRLGAYLIGGGGWYYRHNNLDHHITITAGTACTPALVWWGAACTSGSVTSDQTLSSYGVNALGWNAGVGFTVKVGEPSYRFYMESRYHYAPTKNFNTQFVNGTIGIRY
jgi:Outer membrane protein beta-barrel domain